MLTQPDQDPIRYQVNKNIQHILKHTENNHAQNKQHYYEKRTLNSIKRKLDFNRATIIKSDKGNTIVITYLDTYHTKIQEFINTNNFTRIASDPTKKFQKELRQAVNKCSHIIPTSTKHRYVMLHPTSPQIRGLIKVHKPETPIRPVINWTNAPAYRLAQKIVSFINTHLPLPYAFNVKNTTHLINDLKEIAWNKNLHVASFDISNMYTNIPTDHIPTIIHRLCNHHNIDTHTQSELLHLCQLILTQNYFNFRSVTYIQTSGLAMGAPTSSLFSEVFLQFLEATKLFVILVRHHIIGYFRYVDDILLVYDSSMTNIHHVLDQFNDATPTLTFTIELEKDNILNFLDISILQCQNTLEFKIFRKHTATDVIIPSTSNHPREHKEAAIRYLLHRCHTYPISEQYRQVELNTIYHILHANQYSPHIAKILSARIQSPETIRAIQNTTHYTPSQNNLHRFAVFTYTGKETRFITKLFKNTNIKVTYRTRNTIEQLLRPKRKLSPEDLFEQSGVYRLTCPDCNMIYIGQTGRSFRTRYREHLHSFKYRTENSRFARHLWDNNHSFGPITSVMKIIQCLPKGTMMDTTEYFHIYKATKLGIQINDKNTTQNNMLFTH